MNKLVDNDPKYKAYVTQIDKALRAFENTSEWADLIASLAKLNKVLAIHNKYSTIPKKFLIGKRLAQCLHPALPNGVHLKVLETYDLIFKCIGSDELALDIFTYCSGLFPLLGYAAINVRPVLIQLYETHLLPLGASIRPAMTGLIMGLLPGFENGSELYDRTYQLLESFCKCVEKPFFYCCMWECICVSANVRHAGLNYILMHFDKKVSVEDQIYLIGTNLDLVVHALCLSLEDKHPLVQRCVLDLLMLCFPIHSCQLPKSDIVQVVMYATNLLLKRDMSLNRRLYAWLMGTDINGMTSFPNKVCIQQDECQGFKELSYFDMHSKEVFVLAIKLLLKGNFETNLKKPTLLSLKIVISLLDRPELISGILSDLLLDILKCMYEECVTKLNQNVQKILEEKLFITDSLNDELFFNKMKNEEQVAILEIYKTANILFAKFDPNFIWNFIAELFESSSKSSPHVDIITTKEFCNIVHFLLDKISIESYPEAQVDHFPMFLSRMVNIMGCQLDVLSDSDIVSLLNLGLKMFSRIINIFGIQLEYGTYSNRAVRSRCNEITRTLTLGAETDLQFKASFTKPGFVDKLFRETPGTPEELDHDGECPIHNILQRTSDKHNGCIRSLIKDYLAFFHQLIWKRIIVSPSIEHSCFDYLFLYTNKNASWEMFCKLVINAHRVNADFNLTNEVELLESACHILEQCLMIGKYDVMLDDAEVPRWFRSLLIVCLTTPFSFQYVALNHLFNLVEFCQTTKDLNNFTTRCIEILNETCFYKVAAFSIWRFISENSSQVPLKAAEIFNRIHQNAPFGWICENVIAKELLSPDQEKALRSCEKFASFWNCLKDLDLINARQFEKCILILLDNLDNDNDMLASLSKSWIISCAKAGDLIRILEPIIKILLHPDTARVSVQQNESQRPGGCMPSYINNNISHLHEANIVAVSNEGGNIVYHVDNQSQNKSSRKMLPEEYQSLIFTSLSENGSNTKKCSVMLDNYLESSRIDESRVTLHINPIGSCENEFISPETSSKSQDIVKQAKRLNLKTCAEEEICFKKSDFEPDSDMKIMMISDIIDEILFDVVCKDVKSPLNYIEKGDIISSNRSIQVDSPKKKLNSLRSYILLYIRKYDFSRVLYAIRLLKNFFNNDSKVILNILLTSNMSYFTDKIEGGTATELLLRHKQSIMGQNFHHNLVFDVSDNIDGSTYLELIILGLLYFIRSFFDQDSTYNLESDEVKRNMEVQISSCGLLYLLFTEIAKLLQGNMKLAKCISSLLLKTKVQKTVLYSLYSGLKSTIDVDSPYVQSNLSKMYTNTLLSLVTSLIQLEDHLLSIKGEENTDYLPKEFEQMDALANETFPLKTEMLFLSGQPIIYQPIFLEAIIYSLKLPNNELMHIIWINFVQNLLPYFSKASSKILTSVILQLCLNMERFERSAINRDGELQSDYYIFLMKSLTSMYHHCLFDYASGGYKEYTGQAVDIGKMLQSFSGQILSGISNAFNFQSRKFSNHEDPSQNHFHILYLQMIDLLPNILKNFLDAWKFSEKLDNLMNNKSPKMNFTWSTRTKQCILQFLHPLADNFMHSLLAAFTIIWNEKCICRSCEQMIDATSSNEQVIIVNMLKEVKHVNLNSLATTIRQMLKQPGSFSSVFHKNKFLSLEGGLLQMFYAFIKQLPDHITNESLTFIISFLRDCYQTNLDSSAVFISICILTFVLKNGPLIEEKREHREIQDITNKLLESCSNIAGLSLEQAYFFRKYLAVKEDFVLELDTKNLDEVIGNPSSADSSMGGPQCQTSIFFQSVQALHVLAEVTSILLDVVFQSDEKDKVAPLLNNILSNVFPYLRNHKLSNMTSFGASSKMIANLSSYQYTRRSWKKECFELLMDSNFFQMDLKSLKCWITIIDNLMAHDKSTFSELLARFSLAQTGSLSLFGSREAEAEMKTQLLKRLSFTIFCSEIDQYQKYMPDIQEKLFDCLRSYNSPRLHAEVFSCFRVLVLRMSCYYLTSLWPTMITELIQVFVVIQQNLKPDSEDIQRFYKTTDSLVNAGCDKYNDLFLAACKLLDLFLALPSENLPNFQLYKWAFVADLHTVHPSNLFDLQNNGFVPYALKIAKQMQLKFGMVAPKKNSFGHLIIHASKISSLRELQEFFTTICMESLEVDDENTTYRSNSFIKSNTNFTTMLEDSSALKIIESVIMTDFLEELL